MNNVKAINKVDIYNVLVDIFEKRAKINFDKYSELKCEKLFGEKIMMPSRELVLALFDIEKYFSISIPEEEFLTGNFNSFDNIYSIVRQFEDSINFN